MKKCVVGFVIFSLLLTIPVLADYKGKSLTQIKTAMNSFLELLGPQARILKIVKNPTGKVDFYSQITISRFRDKRSYAILLGCVIGLVARCTSQTSWASDKLYVCPANTDKPTDWIYTRDCRFILRQNEENAWWDDSDLARAIFKHLHEVKK